MTRFLSIALLSIYTFAAQADIHSANNALSRGDYETAVKEFTKLAEQGDASAQANLGYMYYAGEGVAQSFENAVYWYRKAATQGNRDAQYNLAVSYAFGEGVKQDLTEAAIWYRRAGEQGHVVSQYSLGISYAYGEGVPQDQKEAARWFMKAAEQGYARAQVHLGSMYHTGEGVNKDYSEAARWYRMAADRGDATAQYNLGTMYRSGKGVEQNYAQAKRWFRQSSDQGYAAATNELASLERSAAANVATRTIQSKPELLPTEIAEPTQQQTADSAPPEKQEPPQQEQIIAEEKAEAIPQPEPVDTESVDTNTSSKKPLFSVETKDLLTLDESNLDISEANSIEELETQQEENTPEKVVESVAETEDVITETETPEEIEETKIATTADAPSEFENVYKKQEEAEAAIAKNEEQENKSSGGFFSKLGGFFSGKKSAEADIEINEQEDQLGNEELITDEEPATINEETEFAEDVKDDLSEYSVSAGRNALKNSDFDEAVRQFKPLAESGDSEAQAHLGSLYYVGKGVNKDIEQAYNWYKKAADQGNVDAQYSLGNMHLLGESVEQSNADAAKWYSLASDQGHSAAKSNLEKLEKLEALNKENELKLDAVATQQEAEITETVNEEIEIQNEVVTIGTDETEGTKVADEIIENEVVSNEEETELITDIELSDTTIAEKGNSPDFFSRLFENADKNIDSIALQTTDEINEVETVEPEEIVTTEVETAITEEIDEQPIETIAASTGEIEETEQKSDQKSPGFFSRLFGSDDEDTETIALVDSETSEVTTDIETTVNEEFVEDVSTLSELDRIRPLATQGDADAQYQLGIMYYAGSDDVKQDYSQASLWYRRAAQQGHVDAQYSIGNMYLMGEGVGQNDEQAAEWYAMAAEQGHSSAQHNLANIQKTQAAISEEVETTNTSQLLSLDDEQSVNDDSAEALYEQALAYAFGDGVPQDDRAAFNLFYEAAEQGYALAQYKLGVAFAYGEGVRQDNKQAAEWYRKAAEQGHTIAQRNIATMYLNGTGVEQSKVQALAWYEVVAYAGNGMDLHRRDKLKSELSEIELNESLQLAKQINSRITNPSL